MKNKEEPKGRRKKRKATAGWVFALMLIWTAAPVFSQSNGPQAIDKSGSASRAASINAPQYAALSRSASSLPEAEGEKSKDAADPAATKKEVEDLRLEVERLRTLVDALMKEREAASSKTEAAVEPAQSQSQSIYGQHQEPKDPKEEKLQELPGRGNTNQGLYGTVAAGSSRGRYGRSLFGENVRIGGYGSFRYEANNLDDLPKIGNLPLVRRSVNGFDIRRLVLTADVTPSDRLRFYTEVEFERFGKLEIERKAIPENRGGASGIRGTRFIEELEGQDGSELKLEQFWAQYDLSKNFGIRGGIILPPLGRFNILHDDDYYDIPRRTLVDRDAPVTPMKTAWSEAGIGFIGSKQLGQGFLNYQFYVVNGVTLDFSVEKTFALRDDKAKIEFEPEIGFESGPVNGSRAAQAVTWRLGVSPRIGNEIAISGYHGKYTPEFLQTKAYINSFGIDGKFTKGAFEAEGEFIYTDYGKMQGVLADLVRNLVNSEAEDEFNETETEVAVGLKGPFANQRYGFWFDAKYRWRPSWLKNSVLGEGFSDPQLIPIVRYERVWFNKFVRELEFKQGMAENFDVEDLSQDRITLGLTYRPISSVPISFAYQHNQRRNGSTLIFPNTLGLGRAPDRSFDAFLIGVSFGF